MRQTQRQTTLPSFSPQAGIQDGGRRNSLNHPRQATFLDPRSLARMTPVGGLRKRRFNRHPAPVCTGVTSGRGPRPAQVIDYAEGVGTGLRRYGGKFELFRDSIAPS